MWLVAGRGPVGGHRRGARALGLVDRGHLLPGERADFVVVDHRDWRALLYRPGNPPIHAVYVGGEVAFMPNP